MIGNRSEAKRKHRNCDGKGRGGNLGRELNHGDNKLKSACANGTPYPIKAMNMLAFMMVWKTVGSIINAY